MKKFSIGFNLVNALVWLALPALSEMFCAIAITITIVMSNSVQAILPIQLPHIIFPALLSVWGIGLIYVFCNMKDKIDLKSSVLTALCWPITMSLYSRVPLDVTIVGPDFVQRTVRLTEQNIESVLRLQAWKAAQDILNKKENREEEDRLDSL